MSIITSADVDRYVDFLKKEFPGLGVYYKKSWWLNLIFHAPLIKKFKWFNYTQTIGNNIWFADDWKEISPSSRLITLRHERKHLLQFKKYGLILMCFLYLFVFFPIGLAYFRAKFEREGYKESTRARVEYFGATMSTKESCRNMYLDRLCGPAYLYSWPFRKTVFKWFYQDWNSITGEKK